MRIHVSFIDRVGITQEVLALLGGRNLNLDAVEMVPPNVYIDAPTLSAEVLEELRVALLQVHGVQSVEVVDILPGQRRRLQLDEGTLTVVLNKPRHVVSAMSDPEGRRDLTEFTAAYSQRLYHVGRLDYETEGLLLLTNDGELANRLMHPSYEVPKTYLAEIRAPIPKDLGRRLREGVELEDGVAQVDSFKLVDSTPGHVLVEVVLHSGKNRIVRRMFQEIGHPVERLVRVKVGPILLGDQKQGTVRALNAQELGHLKALVGL